MRTSQPDFESLRPLYGSRIDALEQTWLTSDAGERHEIEVVAELLRRRAAGTGTALLQPPPSREADGAIRLGRIVHGDHELGWLGVARDELMQHMAVTGRSGSGKSTLCLHVARQLLDQNIPWLIFDYKRSARALRGLDDRRDVHVASLGRDIGATLSFNPLVAPPGVPLDSHIRTTVEMIARSWFAGDGVMSLLERIIWQAYEAMAPTIPTLKDVKATLEETTLKGREAQWSQSCQRILMQLTTGQLGRVLCRRRDAAALDQLRWNHTVVELDGLATNDANFLTQHLVHHLTQTLLEARERETLRFVVLIEEAHHLLARHDGQHETVLETCLREGREIGLGIILADQCISAISPTALANCFTVACLTVRQRADVNAGAASLLTIPQRNPLKSSPHRWTADNTTFSTPMRIHG